MEGLEITRRIVSRRKMESKMVSHTATATRFIIGVSAASMELTNMEITTKTWKRNGRDLSG